MTPYLKVQNGVMPIFNNNIAYVRVQPQTFPTVGRSMIYFISSKYLFDRKITFKAMGRRSRGRPGRTALALYKLNLK